jgi:hypothetical protein
VWGHVNFSTAWYTKPVSRAWKIFWIAEAVLLLPLVVYLVATPLGFAAGCYNFLELGCAAGLPDILGGTGFLAMIIAIFTTPVAVLIGFFGLVVYLYSISRKSSKVSKEI